MLFYSGQTDGETKKKLFHVLSLHTLSGREEDLEREREREIIVNNIITRIHFKAK